MTITVKTELNIVPLDREIGHFGEVLPSQSLLGIEKIKPNKTKLENTKPSDLS